MVGIIRRAWLPLSQFTPANILAKLLTVDGSGSGLDADTVDGSHASAFQPVDADLTAIAALTTTSFGRGFLTLADAAAGRSSLGLDLVGIVVPCARTTAPTGWLFCYGQDVSRTTYSALFSAIGTTYGAGNGSTTFTLPDLRGRVVAGQDDMGGTSANRLTSPINGDTLGASGGSESHTLATAEMPSHDHQTVFAPGVVAFSGAGTRGDAAGGAANFDLSMTSTGARGGGGAHNNVQPTIILNYIIFAGA